MIRVTPDWWHAAACRGKDTNLWFATDESQTWRARCICAHCPVRGECLAEALGDLSRQGIWGGLDEHQRDRLRRRIGRTSAA